MAPNPIDCVLEFNADTVNLKFADNFKVNENSDNNLIEKMSCKIDKDAFVLQKISGGSPYDESVPGTYLFVIKDNKLTLVVVKDDCVQRSSAFPEEPLAKFQ